MNPCHQCGKKRCQDLKECAFSVRNCCKRDGSHCQGHEPLVEEKREYETCPACNGYTGSGCEACGDTGTVIKKPSPEQTERGTSCEKCAYTKCRCSLGKKFLEGFEDVCRAISLGWVEWQEKGLFSNGYSDGQEKMLDLIAQVEAKAEARGKAIVVEAVERIMPTVIDPDETAAGDKIIEAARNA